MEARQRARNPVFSSAHSGSVDLTEGRVLRVFHQMCAARLRDLCKGWQMLHVESEVLFRPVKNVDVCRFSQSEPFLEVTTCWGIQLRLNPRYGQVVNQKLPGDFSHDVHLIDPSFH